jgi:hypothetical protein
MCVRCQALGPAAAALDDDELCIYCATLTRIEAQRGLVQLEAYLAKWAEFERWQALERR